MSRRREHAIIQKKVINLDHGVNNGPTKYVMCAWDTCENDGYELYKAIVHHEKPGYPLYTVTHVFCCERHKMYWVHNTKRYGYLPNGYRQTLV